MTATRAKLPAAPLAIVVAGTMLVAGYATTLAFGPVHVGRMLPWVLGRGLGIAAYLTVVALTAVGLWLRHPWRTRLRHPAPQVQLRVHATLAGLALALVAGHVVSLVLDTYAGVGWRGAVVPNASHYRPVPVALGTLAVYLGVLVGVSAALAGRIVRRAWLPVHRLAAAVFALTWLHGLLAGSDSARLLAMYLASGALVGVLAISRRAASAPAPALGAAP